MKSLKRSMLFALIITASAISLNAQQKSTLMGNSATSGYAPVNGLKMYYEIHGSGSIPLVLIHGGGSTIESSFGKILPLLSAHGKVIAVELQAHGRTNDRNAPESFEQDADDVTALLKYLKVDKANILGFSNGGTTTLQIAMRHPEVVNKIIVISANYRRDGMPPGFFDGFEHATLDNMPEALQEAFLKVTPDKSKLQVMFERDVERMKSFKDIPDESIQSIKVPALLMISDHDVVLPEHMVKMSRLISNSHLVILPGGHGSVTGAMEAGDEYSLKKGSKVPEMAVAMIEEFLS